MIEFDSIPSDLRLPGVRIEFNSSRAGHATFRGVGLIIGQRLAAGSVAAGVVTNITGNGASPDVLFGESSQISEMIKVAKKAQPFLQLYAVALDDNPAGVKAVKSVLWAGTATESTTLNAYIGGYRVQVAVLQGDTAAIVAANLAAAIQALAGVPVAAAVDGTTAAKVNLTCLWKGETGNAIDVRFAYFDGDALPAGLTYTLTTATTGSGNPDIAVALDALGATWFNWIASPFADASNLTKLEALLGTRFGPMQAIGGTAFLAYAGTLAATSSFGATRNSQWVSCMAAGLSPTAPWLWAAAYMAVAGAALGIDPSRMLRGKILTGLLPPAQADRWDDAQRNGLLWDGIATSTVDACGNVLIEAEISMYQTNPQGGQDDTWLYIQTPETLSRIRLEQAQYFDRVYPNWKLADDTYVVPPGQPIMQPKKVIMEFLGLYTTFMGYGWVEDFDNYKASILAEIDADNANRCDVFDQPKLIKNMRLLAVHTEFS